jgi:EpsI family protein
MVFVLAMALLAGIGALLAEPEPSPKPPRDTREDLYRGTPGIAISRFVLAGLLIASFGTITMFRTDMTVPLKKPLRDFPSVVSEWQTVSQETFSSEILEVLKPTEYLSRTYSAPDGSTVRLYIGYHGGGKDGGEIHSPNHCLPGSGWQKLSSSRTGFDSPTGRINLVKAVYRQGEHSEQFYYWFQVREKTLSDEYSLKLAELSNSLLHRRRDAAFVRISVPVGSDADKAVTTGERFIKDFYPVITGFLPD